MEGVYRMDTDRFQVCATCVNFLAVKKENRMFYFCDRLGYETKPNYKFNCWTPKEHVKNLMRKRMEEDFDEESS